MCTVTVVPHERGIRLLCNRDERRTRASGLPPQTHDLGGHRAAFPVDPQGGGTWVGVNDAGVAAALLNVQRTSSVPCQRPKRSRGLIVPEVLRCTSLAEAIDVIAGLDAGGFEPFRVVVVHAGRVALATACADGSMQCSVRDLDAPVLFTSSSLGDALVELPRRRLFERMVLRVRAGWLDGQARFHDHRWPHRPDISVRMERPGALTVSRTRIDVANHSRQLVYEAPVSADVAPQVHRWCSLH